MNGYGILAVWHEWFTDTQFLGNDMWRWAALVGIILGSLIVGKTIGFFLGRQAEKLRQAEKFNVLAMTFESAVKPISLLALGIALYVVAAGGILILAKKVSLSDASDKKEVFDLAKFWMQVSQTIISLAIGWFVYRLVDVVEVFLRHWTSKTETELDDQFVPLIRKTLRILIVIMIFLFIAQKIYRMEVGTLVAGLGIGGLAFALAAKDMVANLLGSITIFTDRPFHMGEWIKMSGYNGIVEEVGFRSTRIRTFDGHLVVIPNADVANSPVENVSRRSSIRRNLDVTVTYDTSPEKMNRAVAILKEMCEARKEHFAPEPNPRVHFTDFNADSLGIRVTYWFAPPEWEPHLEFDHDFNMELLERFNAEGIEFAFPTQTLYLRHENELKADIQVRKPCDD